MVSILALGILAALVITGAVTILFSITSTPPRNFDLIHWAGAIFCIAVTSTFITGAITAGKAVEQVNYSADAVNAISSGVSNPAKCHLTGETSLQADLHTLTSSQIESLRDSLNHKFHHAIIWSIVITVALNLLYLLLLTTAERVSKTVPTSDGFDDMDSDISNIGNFDSSIDDDFC